MSKQSKLLELADKIDHEELWRRAGMGRDKMTDDQRARLDAGVMLRRYADILEPGRWLVIPPTGPMQFSASTLEKAAEMAGRGPWARSEIERLQADNQRLRGLILKALDLWWPFVHGTHASNAARDLRRELSDGIQPGAGVLGDPENYQAIIDALEGDADA